MRSKSAKQARTPSPRSKTVAVGARLRALAEKVEQCLKALARAAYPEALHDARVSLRRIVTLLGALNGAASGKALKVARKLLKRSNKARDLQVLLAWLRAPHQDADALPEPALTAHFEREFNRRLRKVRTFGRRHFTRFSSALEQLCAALQPLTQRPRNSAMRGLVRRKNAQLRRALSGISGVHDRKRLHTARLLCKETRYLAELLPIHESSRLCARLHGLQDALGQIRDFDIMRAAVGKVARTAARTHTAALIERAVRGDIIKAPVTPPGESALFSNCLRIIRTLNLEQHRAFELSELNKG